MNRSSGEPPFWPPPPGWKPGGGDEGVDQSDLAQDLERESGTETPQRLRPKSFLFGDPRRLRSLALGCVTAIAAYPVFWTVTLFMFALGGGAGRDATDSEQQSLAQGFVLIAAGFVALAVVVVAYSWRDARKSYPPDSYECPSRLETGLWGVALVVVTTLAALFGVWAWHLDYT